MSSALEDIAIIECEKICNKIAIEQWYIDLQDEIILLRKKLDCELLNTYDELCIKLHCRTEEEIYKQGFKDGMKI